MKFLFLLLALSSLPAFADVCICQYPKWDAEFGAGYDEEVGFYKMGCSLWLMSEMGCRKEKITNINNDLKPYLDQVLRPKEKIRIGYVGHWESSIEFVFYLKRKVEPLLSVYKTPIKVDNTACLAMEDAELVQEYLETIPSTKDVYLKVQGAQTTSIGMWDKVWPGKRKADLVARGDSLGTISVYPACKEFLKKGCTAFQDDETGICLGDKGVKTEIICRKGVKRKKDGVMKEKNTRRWYLENDEEK